MFIDASALVSIIANESDGAELRRRMRTTKHRHVSGMVIYETVLALIRLKGKSRAETLAEVNQFVKLNAIKFISPGIDQDLSELALEAFERYGKGNHPARLNMGDCFSYACAKLLKQPLLYKGNDFSKTDILNASI
jgi:ribonuclease VapC